MLKIFLTGDNHIGLRYASHSRADVLIQNRIAAFADMVTAANAENCGLFVIAGDLFERTTGIAKKDIRALIEMLSQFRGTVAVLPGNHDYYDTPVKVWQDFRAEMAATDNILLLDRYAPYTVTVGDEQAILYPAFCSSLHAAHGENNLGWIKEQSMETDGTYRIGIAHGAVEGETIDSEGAYFLMTRQELESIPVDVWLMGHTHVPFPRNLSEEMEIQSQRIFNAGTHVQTDVACHTEGQCFILQIDEDKTVRAKKFVSGNVRFYRKTITVSAGQLESRLQEELDGIPDNAVVDILLTGAVTAEEYDRRTAVIEAALSRFLEGSYNDYGLNKLISQELIDREFSETSFSAGLLTALLDEPKEAQLVYELLQSLKEGK